MVYTLNTKRGVAIDSVSVGNLRTLGSAFEKAVELLAYFDEGTEMLIINEYGSSLYSIVLHGNRKFVITDLS